MIRLVFWLCIGLVGVGYWAGTLEPRATVQTTPAEPATPDAAPRIRLQDRPAKKAAAPAPAPAPSFAINLPDGVTMTHVALTTDSRGLTQVSHRDAPAGYTRRHAAASPAPAAEGEAVVITGNRVNLRAGPGTGNPVVGTLTRNMRAVVIARPGNGWVELHAPIAGLTGFMSARFVAPAG